jgi:hypothetical protein
VVYAKVLAAIMSVNGVEDVPALTVGTSGSPTGTGNVVMDLTERATSDATDGSLSLTQV